VTHRCSVDLAVVGVTVPSPALSLALLPVVFAKRTIFIEN
jgi:hypothetical protein